MFKNTVKFIVIVLVVAIFQTANLSAEEKLELKEVKFDLPKPMFVGTPKGIKADNLEAPRKGARKPLRVPDGVENIAIEREVTSSEMIPIVGDLEQIVDEDKDASDGSFVELGDGLQWVQINLDDPAELYGILLWHYHQQPRVYRDVIIQSADDQDFLENVQTLFNNDHDNSAGLGKGEDKEYVETFEGKLIHLDKVKTQYLRFYTRGNTSNDLNHYTEIAVYGKPAS